MSFPRDFLWGVSTSSFQIEGAANEDGRGLSIWDVFCGRPGNIRNGHAGDVACDHYHRYREDVALMKQLGIRANRFSVSWPRVLPSGIGAVNEKGLAFYDRLVDELLAAGVRPFLALYHWDLPWELQCRGGWQNREIADWFAEYARVVVGRLSDRVTDWVTFVEPAAFLGGLVHGKHAPGMRLPRREVLRAVHHVHLAHGRAARVIRECAKRTARIALSHVGKTVVPAGESAEDIEAARRLTMGEVESPFARDSWTNAWLLDPLYRGEYPAAQRAALGADAPEIRAGDMETICQPLDFFALNYYHAEHGRAGADGRPEPVARPVPPGHYTAFDWEMRPEGLYWAIRFFHERYGLPVTVTENGMANLDWPDLDGRVRDPQRIDFVRRHLRSVRRALAEGLPVDGYFAWSLLDNFEWAEGYEKRFGLVYVDYETQQRIPKDSARWYARTIAGNGADLCP